MWRDSAACKGATHIFAPIFNDMRGTVSQELLVKAKEVCQTCPVKAQCLEYAIQAREEYGLWAGKTPKEIRAHAAWLKKLGA